MLWLLLLPTSLCQTHRDKKQRGEEPRGTPTGSTDCGPSPSFNCLALSSLKRVEKGRETEHAEHMHSWNLLQTRQKHLGNQQFHDIIIFLWAVWACVEWLNTDLLHFHHVNSAQVSPRPLAQSVKCALV